MLGLFWIQSLWPSDSIPERIFRKIDFEKKSAGDKKAGGSCYKCSKYTSITMLIAAYWILEPFGEVGAKFCLQLSSWTHFAKINNKKMAV